jgi:hypothetical protein
MNIIIFILINIPFLIINSTFLYKAYTYRKDTLKYLNQIETLHQLMNTLNEELKKNK